MSRAGWAVTALLLLGGATLTLARLWQPATGPVADLQVRLAALVPAAIPVYAAALALAALLARRGRGALLPALLAVVGLLLHLWWFAPQLTDDAGAATDGATVRVLTVNAYVHDGATGEDLVGLARSTRADVVVVQELTPATYDEALRAGLDDLLPHRAGGREHGATMLWSRLPLRDAQDLEDRTGGGSVRARVETVDGSLDLLGVHTAPPIWPRPWRADHAALLEVVRADRPDVVAGDLNATTDHVQLRRLLDEGLRDGGDLTGAGWSPTWPSNGRVRALGLALPRFAAIDHVLVSSAWTVLDQRRLDVPGSDHAAVLAEVAPAG